MNKVLVMLSTVSLLTIVSCSKSKNEPEIPKISCTISELNFTNSYGLKYKSSNIYDDKGRLGSEKSEGDNFTTQSIYNYSNSQISELYTEIYNGSSNTNETVYKLDANNRIIQSQDPVKTSNYSYNSEGYLVQRIIPIYNGHAQEIIKLSYTNGNLTLIQSPYNNLLITYGDELATGNISIDIEETRDFVHPLPLQGYFGKPSKNLPIKALDQASGYTENYTYKKDSNGNIINVNMTANNGSNSSKVIKFNCK